MRRPYTPMRPMRDRLRMGSLGSRGFWESRSPVAGSTPMAMAGRESVSRLINSR